ncbi:unnamed protein product [Allacma fusca]|uniref:Uncharacterized protein n=1 Tax=Allacma fusca TaxID=39272 RepID=A0A8J2LX18_9HEXA|nr:unnamed protein product [Allacma fusca]
MDNSKSMTARTHLQESSPFPVPLILKRTENLRKAAPFLPEEVAQEPRNYYLVDVNMWELLHHNYFKRLPSAPASSVAAPVTPTVKPVPRSLKFPGRYSHSNASNRFIRPRVPPEFCLRPSLPTEFNFRPIVSTEFNFRPSLSTELGFRPNLPTELSMNFQPSLPTGFNFRSTLPSDLNFRSNLLPGPPHSREEKCVGNQTVTTKSMSTMNPALPVLPEKRPSTVAPKLKKAKSPAVRKRRLSEHQSPVSRKKCGSGCKLSHRIQPVCLNKVFQNASMIKKPKDATKSSKPLEHSRPSAPRRTAVKRDIFKESEYYREYRSEEELQSKFRGIQYHLFDELEVKEAIAETHKILVNT